MQTYRRVVQIGLSGRSTGLLEPGIIAEDLTFVDERGGPTCRRYGIAAGER